MYERRDDWRDSNDGECIINRFCDERRMNVNAFREIDLRGRDGEILGYELQEFYRLFMQNGKHYCSAPILEFNNQVEATFFLTLFKWLLNYDEKPFANSPELLNCRREISKCITRMLANPQFDKIAKRHEQRAQIIKKIQEAEHPELTRVYAFHFDNNCTKIGISNNVYQRANQLEVAPLIIDKLAYTKTAFTKDKARQVEMQCHEFFRPKHRCLEYFNIPFEEACRKLQEYSDLYIAEDRYLCKVR